jgi:hypothetical protein
MDFEMKKMILVFLMACSASAALAQAPLCHEVLAAREPNPEDISKTIKDLAKLRFDLDMRKTEGRTGLAWKQLSSNYESKEKELTAVLEKSGKTLADVKKQIGQEIRKIQQNKNAEEKNVETERRQQDRAIRIVSPYEITDSMPVSGIEWRQLDLFVYLEKTDKVIFRSQSRVLAFHLGTRQNEVLAEKIRIANVTEDKKRLLTIDDDFKLKVRELSSNAVLHEVTLVDPASFDNLLNNFFHRATLSPDGGKIALLGSKGQIAIYDVQTGELLKKTDPRPGNALYTKVDAQFLDDETVLFTSEDRLAKFHYKTNQTTYSEPLGQQQPIKALALSADRKHAIFNSKETIRTVSIDTMATEASETRKQIDATMYQPISSMPDSFFVRVWDSGNASYGIYSANTLRQVFDFEKYYSDKLTPSASNASILNVGFSKDRKSAIVLSITTDGYMIDRWTTP